MRLGRHPRRTFLLLATLIVFSSTQLEAAPPEVELAGRTVSMELVKKEDLSPAAWPDETISLTTYPVITKAGDSIFDLLEANGVQPDNEAYTLVYDLNLGLEKIDPLPNNVRLVLPKVSGGPLFQRAREGGYLVMLTTDAKIKAQLSSSAGALNVLSPRFAQLERSRFAVPASREECIGFVQDMTGWFGHMSKTIAQRTAKPLRRVTLMQIANEADILRHILEQPLTTGQPLAAADQAQITAIHKDLEQLIVRWDEKLGGGYPSGDLQFNVVVEILGHDQKRIRTLRVYYVVDGLFRNPPTNPPVRSTNFNGLGSGSSAMLPIKDYKVWAAQDGDPEHPATPPADLKVRRPASGDVIKFALTLLEPPPGNRSEPGAETPKKRRVRQRPRRRQK